MAQNKSLENKGDITKIIKSDSFCRLPAICSSVFPVMCRKQSRCVAERDKKVLSSPVYRLGTEVIRKLNNFPSSQHKVAATETIKGGAGLSL